jgi:hypothetical protein
VVCSDMLCIYMLLKSFRRDSHMLYRYHPRIHLARSTREVEGRGGEVDLRFVNLGRGDFTLPLRSRDTSSSGSA